MTNIKQESFQKDKQILFSAQWSCPCCAFIPPSPSMLFLQKPTSLDNSSEVIDTTSDQNTNIINDDSLPNSEKDHEQLPLKQTFNELIKKHQLYQAHNDSTKSPFILVDTHGHPHLQKEPSIPEYDMPFSYFKNCNNKNEIKEQEQEKDEKMNMKSNQINRNYDISPLGEALMDIQCISLTCAVSCHDWKHVLQYASSSPYILPALGVHPWYIEDVLSPNYRNEVNIIEEAKTATVVDEQKNDQNVKTNINDQLQSSVPHKASTTDDPMNSSMPPYIQDLKTLLHQHPLAFVGEIGLCKSAKNIRFHPDGKKAGLHQQTQVFIQQFKLAAAMKRGVTIHCVGYHKELLNAIKQIVEDAYKSVSALSTEEIKINDETSKTKSFAKKSVKNNIRNALPPVISFHSFSGSASFVQEICKIEEALYCSSNVSYISEVTSTCKTQSTKLNRHQRKKNHQNANNEISVSSTSILKSTLEKHINTPSDVTASLKSKAKPIFYFGYSHLINVSMASQSPKSIRKNKEALRSIPMERILVESDVSHSNNIILGAVGAIDYIAKSLDKPLQEIAYLVTNNGIRFLSEHANAASV